MVSPTSSADEPPRVKIGGGVIEGLWDNGVAAFKGVPYGGPVDGERRWKRAEKPATWSGVRVADRYGPRAMQNGADNLQSADG